jgi:uridine phosphorylase
LTIVRLGTCGALQDDIEIGSFVVSHSALGLDGALHFYANEQTDAELRLLHAVLNDVGWPDNLPIPYVATGDPDLVAVLGQDNHVGITATAGGFYGPQGRVMRALPAVPHLNDELSAFRFPGSGNTPELRITNYEMETSALYGLSGLLGHRACTICAVVANRRRERSDTDHHASIERMIGLVLERIAG